MTGPPTEDPEEQNSAEYDRFLRLLTEVAAVPKVEVYSLDPTLSPKRKTAPKESESDDKTG